MPSRSLLNILLVGTLLVAGILVYALVTRMAAPRVDPIRGSNPGELSGRIIQVEILNGCGIDDLASQTRNYVRDHGFDVVKVGNYETSDLDSSMVIDRVGDMESAQKVANVLGISRKRVLQELDSDIYLDVSIVLGKDYRSLRPFRE